MKNVITPEDLLISQQEILNRLEQRFKNLVEDENSKKKGLPQQNVFALIGDRGSGKTTVLQCFEHYIEDMGYCSSGLIDANKIKDQGIMASIIESLWAEYQRVVYKDPSENPIHSRRDRPSHFRQNDKILKELYRETHQLAQLSEELIRELAREMAMSPEQYMHKISELDEMPRAFPSKFNTFIETLNEAYVHATQKPSKGFVIFLDDLDLAKKELIKNWATTFMIRQPKTKVFWVLSFARKRFLAAISSEKINGNGLEMDTGEALLSKMVSFQQQFTMPSWEPDDRLSFRPFEHEYPYEKIEGSEKASIKKLLKDIDYLEFMLLLPSTPRGLLHLYHLLYEVLRKKKSPSKADSANSLKPGPSHLLMNAFCDANGTYDLKDYLHHTWARRMVLEFKWNESELSKFSWSAIIKEANLNDTLRGLPIPEVLQGLVATTMPTIHLELFCNLGLKEGVITPYRLLHEIPFTRDRITECRASLPLEKHHIKAFGNAPKHYCWTLPWGSWEYNEEEVTWEFVLGPDIFIDSVFAYRNIKPIEGFRREYVPGAAVDPVITEITRLMADFLKTHVPPILPKNFRALLLMVDRLQNAPWYNLSNVRNFWGPITMAQCAASFLLSALAYTIWTDETILTELKPADLTGPHLYFPAESFSEIRGQNARAIDQAYMRLQKGLKNLVAQKKPQSFQRKYLRDALKEKLDGLSKQEIEKIPLPYRGLEQMARRELKRFLGLMLEYPAVTNLCLPDNEK